MFPSSPFYNISNVASANIEVCCDALGRNKSTLIKISYLCHLIFRQFCQAMAATHSVIAVAGSIITVALTSVPSKIREIIVLIIIVPMTALQPFRTWAYKGYQYQSPNVETPSMVFVRETYCPNSIRRQPGFEYSGYYGPSMSIISPRPDATKIAGFIKRISRDSFPNFIWCGRLIFSHGRNLLGVWVVVRAVFLREQECGLIFYIIKSDIMLDNIRTRNE